MKYSAVFFSLLLVAGIARAEDGAFLIGEAYCRVVNTAPQADERITWSGNCKDGYAQGSGVLQWYVLDQPVSRYEGEMEGGRPHGTGVYDYVNGRYEGAFKHGKQHGKGKRTTAESILSATFADGYPVGGVEKSYSNGNKYRGELKNGLPEGKGQTIRRDGSQYDGDFKAGAWEGQGVLLRADGARYEGGWKANRFDGFGSIAGGMEPSYTGNWKDGRFDGKGRVKYANGNEYEGEFKDGLFDGTGSLVYFGGGRYDGEWKKGKFDGKGVLVYTSGGRYEGQFENGQTVQIAAAKGVAKTGSTSASGNFPNDKSYAELTAEEQTVVKRMYPTLAPGDEPPYAVGGLQAFYTAMSNENLDVEDSFLSLSVEVDGEGRGSAVHILRSPNAHISQTAAAWLVQQQKYKPAVCGGQPCAMRMPVAIRMIGR